MRSMAVLNYSRLLGCYIVFKDFLEKVKSFQYSHNIFKLNILTELFRVQGIYIIRRFFVRLHMHSSKVK